MKKSPYRRLLVTISLLVFLVFLEISSFGVGVFLSRYGKVYRPQVTESYATYKARLNPLLGWPSRAAIGSGDIDAAGSRIIPAYPDPGRYPTRVSIYGDSFAWSAEVDPAHAWGNVLSALLKCRVANFGIGGYGTDQAYLRFKANRQDPAKVVIMVFSSDDIRRHVNRVRNFIISGPQLGTKPRFQLDTAGQLQLIPLPKFTKAVYETFIKAPSPHLSHEFFLPGGPTGIQPLRFPYTLTLLKSAPLLFSMWRQGTPQYFDFYKPNHPSGALGLTLAIMQAFHREAYARGKFPLIVLVPIFHDQVYFQKHDRWVYQGLIDSLSREKIAYLNLGPGMLAYLGSRPPLEIFQGPRGHFNNEGYRLMAQLVYQKLAAVLGDDLPGRKP